MGISCRTVRISQTFSRREFNIAAASEKLVLGKPVRDKKSREPLSPKAQGAEQIATLESGAGCSPGPGVATSK
jgi:hypothetical protein